MKLTKGILLFAVLGLLAGCSPSREKRVSRISSLEKRLFAPETVNFDKAAADSLLAMYETYIKEYPGDSLSPGYLFKAANVAMNTDDGKKAVVLFDQYIKDYPTHKKAAMCMFFKGFVYENNLHDYQKAHETYLLFIEKNPTNDFVKDARMALMNLGKTPEMLVREFEAKRQADSTRIADSLSKARKRKR